MSKRYKEIEGLSESQLLLLSFFEVGFTAAEFEFAFAEFVVFLLGFGGAGFSFFLYFVELYVFAIQAADKCRYIGLFCCDVVTRSFTNCSRQTGFLCDV